MEQHGLDEVIRELRSRGIEEGEKEAARIVAEAKAKAEEVLSEAKAQAEEISRKALQERADAKATLESELRQAAKVGLAAFRQAIEQGFLIPEIDQAAKDALSQPGFFEDGISEIVKAFAQTGMKNEDIEVLLPERRKKELGDAFLARLAAKGAAGVVVRFDENLSFGFRIGPKGSGFCFDLSDEGFREVLVRFLSPRFRYAFYPQDKKTVEGRS
jgi:V/A-type H+-transporting ATPase subunit E